MTRNEVLDYLDRHEPDYFAAANDLEKDDLSILSDLVQEDDPYLSAAAVYLASLLSDADFIILEACSRPLDFTRTSAAAGIRNLERDFAIRVFLILIVDPETSVRKACLNALLNRFSLEGLDTTDLSAWNEVFEAVATIEREDPIPWMREIAKQVSEIRERR